MSLSDTLFRLALTLAPIHRKAWIDAMQAEATSAGNRMGWAVGAVATAARERIADLAMTGALARAIGGVFVMSTGLGALLYLMPILIHIQDRHGLDRNPENAVLGITIFMLIVIGLIATGAAIMLAGKSRGARIAAKVIVVVMGTGLGSLLIWSGWFSLKPRHHMTVLQHEMMWLSLVAGPALLVAVAALLLKRPRLFLTAGLTALGAETGQWLIELSHHPIDGLIAAAIAFYGACLPTLLMLAAFGLLTPRRSRATSQSDHPTRP